MRHLREGERLDHFETVRRRKDGRLIDVSVSYSPIHDGQGRLIGTAVIARDNSGRRRAERRRNARLAVTQVLAQAADLTEAAPRLLRAICEGLGWSVGRSGRRTGRRACSAASMSGVPPASPRTSRRPLVG